MYRASPRPQGESERLHMRLPMENASGTEHEKWIRNGVPTRFCQSCKARVTSFLVIVDRSERQRAVADKGRPAMGGWGHCRGRACESVRERALGGGGLDDPATARALPDVRLRFDLPLPSFCLAHSQTTHNAAPRVEAAHCLCGLSFVCVCAAGPPARGSHGRTGRTTSTRD